MGLIVYQLRPWVRARWRALVLLSVVVAVAGGLVLVLGAGALRTVSAPDRYSRWRGSAFDATFQQPAGAPRTADVEALPAATHVEMATFVFGQLTARGSSTVDNALLFAGTFGPLGTRLVEGRVASPALPTEFVATKSFVREARAAIGDQFSLTTFTQSQADQLGFDAGRPAGPALTATLVGVMDGPQDLNDGYAVALFPSTLLRQGDVGVAASPGVAKLASGATLEELRRQLGSIPGEDPSSVEKAQWISKDVRAGVSAQGQGLVILSAIVLLTTVVVLGQMLSRQFRLEVEERTVLTSLGMTRSQLAIVPVCRAAMCVIVGALGAGAGSFLSSDRFPVGFVRRIEPHPGRRFAPLVHGLGPALLALVLLGWVASSVSLDGRARSLRSGASAADRLAAAVPSAQAGTALRFAFAASGRRSRTVAPLAGLVIVLCGLFAALTFGANLDHLVDRPGSYGNGFDAALGSGGDEVPPSVVHALDASADVGAVTLFGATTASVGSTSLDVIGMRPVRGGLVPEVLSGRLPTTGGEIALGPLAARDLRVQPGNRVRVDGAGGRRSFEVSGIVVTPSINGADRLGQSALVVQDALRTIDPSAGMSVAAIRYRPGSKAGGMARIEHLTGIRPAVLDPPPTIVNLHRVRGIPFLVAGAVGALGVLSLGHLSLQAVRRRHHDLAVLRAVGATSRWIRGVVHWQATLTTSLALVLALPVGTAGGRLLYRQFEAHIGASPQIITPTAWFSVTVVLLLALANVVAAIPARRSSRRSPASALAQG